MIQEFSALDGAVLIDKPSGPTSHDVVDAIRRHFGIKKVGHCGTLDPNATGLLIIVLGRGTKLSEKLMADDKAYSGWIKLGETTTSYDADGEWVESKPVPPLVVDQLNEAAGSFIGDQLQIPPMVSAVKVEGVDAVAQVCSQLTEALANATGGDRDNVATVRDIDPPADAWRTPGRRSHS